MCIIASGESKGDICKFKSAIVQAFVKIERELIQYEKLLQTSNF